MSVQESKENLGLDSDFIGDARCLEPGGRPLLASVGLDAELSYLSDLGFDTIFEKTLSLSQYLIKKLENNGFQLAFPNQDHTRSGIVFISEPERGQTLWESLKDVCIMTTYRLGLLRFSPYFYQSKEDVDVLISELNHCLK